MLQSIYLVVQRISVASAVAVLPAALGTQSLQLVPASMTAASFTRSWRGLNSTTCGSKDAASVVLELDCVEVKVGLDFTLVRQS